MVVVTPSREHIQPVSTPSPAEPRGSARAAKSRPPTGHPGGPRPGGRRLSDSDKSEARGRSPRGPPARQPPRRQAAGARQRDMCEKGRKSPTPRASRARLGVHTLRVARAADRILDNTFNPSPKCARDLECFRRAPQHPFRPSLAVQDGRWWRRRGGRRRPH